MKITDERLRNTRAWAAAKIGQLSGADVIVEAIDELFGLRQKVEEWADQIDRAYGELPADRFPGPSTSITQEMRSATKD
jgi:hypothetical protein